jgi:hypothetical protein
VGYDAQLLLEADGVRHAPGTAKLAGVRPPRLNHALDSVMMKGLITLGSVLIIISWAQGAEPSSPKPDWQLLLQLGLEEAIARRQLPDLDRVAKEDKVEVLLACKHPSKMTVTLNASALPKQIGKWKLVSVDEKRIRERSASQTYSFVRACSYVENGSPAMRLYIDAVVPPGSEGIVIDRGMLDLRFELRDGQWVIANSEVLYAHTRLVEARCPTAA